MKFAIHYSAAAASLVRSGDIQIDSFKCPAWPDLIPTIQAIGPTYIHFPLKVGVGGGDAIDFETHQPADWHKIEQLMAQTGTPLLNLHLSPTIKDHPDIPLQTIQSADVERLTEYMIHDVESVIRRLGADRVMVENDYDEGGGIPAAACLPEVISQVVKETTCGFLFDLSHARLAAQRLAINIHEYTKALPVTQIRELHITGVQLVDEQWIDLLRRKGLDNKIIQRFAGRFQDHLPMTEDDWNFFEWSMAQIRTGQWGVPWMIAFEYGGVGPLWEAVTEPDVLKEQVPRLSTIIKR